jgi:hypothetical protein
MHFHGWSRGSRTLGVPPKAITLWCLTSLIPRSISDLVAGKVSDGSQRPTRGTSLSGFIPCFER